MASSDKQVFDIAKPGKSTPSQTSRPVIINHGPMMKDPMVAESKDDPDQETKAPSRSISTSLGEKVIAPLESSETNSKEEAEVKQDVTAKSEPEKKPADSIPESKQSDIDAAIDSAAKKEKGDKTDEYIARQAELEKLVEEKKYFVPINQVTHRRNQHLLLVIILVLIVLLAVAYLVLDAKLIDLGVNLPLDIIKS